MRAEHVCEQAEISGRFAEANDSAYPDFYSYENPLERGLWVLWVAKQELGVRRLTAGQIASIIRTVKEIRTSGKSIAQAFKRAGDKIQAYQDGDETRYEIMKPGKDHLLSRAAEGSVQLLSFEPEKRYTSKRLLVGNVFDALKSELRIVDPYCGPRTLDVLSDAGKRTLKFLTRTDNLRGNDRQRFLRELSDFVTENPQAQFRTYPSADIHDRYIISSDCLVLLGHSIKDLGAKESFAVVLPRDVNKDVVDALLARFNQRWQKSIPLP